MTTKPFQVKMDPQAHRQLKRRAGQLHITIGVMIENLLASLEHRLAAIYTEYDVAPTDALDSRLMEILLAADAAHRPAEQLKAEVGTLMDEEVKQAWTPVIRLGSGK